MPVEQSAKPFAALARRRDLGELPAARQLFEQALASHLKAYGEDHPDVATDRNNLALVLHFDAREN